MLSAIIRRLLFTIPVIIATVTILFICFHVAPGDPVRLLSGGAEGRYIPPNVREAYNEKYGFDKPLIVQYKKYWEQIIRGDLGESYKTREDVSDVVRRTVPMSMRLAFWAILIEIVVGIGGGILSALRPGSLADITVTGITTFAIGIPVFVLGFAGQYFFGVLPKQGGISTWVLAAFAFAVVMGAIWTAVGIIRYRKDLRTKPNRFRQVFIRVIKIAFLSFLPALVLFSAFHGIFGWFDGATKYPDWFYLKVQGAPDDWHLFFIPAGKDGWRYVLMPAVVLASVSTALVARVTRSELREVMRSDYIRGARALGVPNSRVVSKHAMRNSLVPVITLIGYDLSTIIGAAILTETVFGWPGIGSTVASAAAARDTQVVIALTTVIVVLTVLISLLVDILYVVLDPRIRLETAEAAR